MARPSDDTFVIFLRGSEKHTRAAWPDLAWINATLFQNEERVEACIPVQCYMGATTFDVPFRAIVPLHLSRVASRRTLLGFYVRMRRQVVWLGAIVVRWGTQVPLDALDTLPQFMPNLYFRTTFHLECHPTTLQLERVTLNTRATLLVAKCSVWDGSAAASNAMDLHAATIEQLGTHSTLSHLPWSVLGAAGDAATIAWTLLVARVLVTPHRAAEHVLDLLDLLRTRFAPGGRGLAHHIVPPYTCAIEALPEAHDFLAALPQYICAWHPAASANRATVTLEWDRNDEVFAEHLAVWQAWTTGGWRNAVRTHAHQWAEQVRAMSDDDAATYATLLCEVIAPRTAAWGLTGTAAPSPARRHLAEWLWPTDVWTHVADALERLGRFPRRWLATTGRRGAVGVGGAGDTLSADTTQRMATHLLHDETLVQGWHTLFHTPGPTPDATAWCRAVCNDGKLMYPDRFVLAALILYFAAHDLAGIRELSPAAMAHRTMEHIGALVTMFGQCPSPKPIWTHERETHMMDLVLDGLDQWTADSPYRVKWTMKLKEAFRFEPTQSLRPLRNWWQQSCIVH